MQLSSLAFPAISSRSVSVGCTVRGPRNTSGPHNVTDSHVLNYCSSKFPFGRWSFYITRKTYTPIRNIISSKTGSIPKSLFFLRSKIDYTMCLLREGSVRSLLRLSFVILATFRVQGQACYGWGTTGSGYCDDFCEEGQLVADYSGNCAPDVCYLPIDFNDH